MKKIIFRFIFILSLIALYIPHTHAQTPANDRNWDTANFIEGFKYKNYSKYEANIRIKLAFIQETYGLGYGCTSQYTDTAPNPYKIYGTYDGDSTNLIFDSIHPRGVTIVTRKQWYHPVKHPQSPNDSLCTDSFQYTTTSLFNEPSWHKTQKYGYWELRLRVPQYTGAASYTDATSGFGANFWMNEYGDGDSLPIDTYYSEIDMFESNSWDNSFVGTLHYHGDNADNIDINAYDMGYYVYPHGHYAYGGWPTPLRAIDSTQGYFYPSLNYNQSPANDTGWHKFGMDWEPNYVKWYIDDTLAKFVNYDYSVFNSAMGMMIGTAFPGGVKKNKNTPIDLPPASHFPYNNEIDYVKRYSLIADCSSAYSACSFSASGYPWGVKKSIEFTGSSCSTDIASGSNITLRAVNSVKLDKNFKVEKGATFNIIMQPCPN